MSFIFSFFRKLDVRTIISYVLTITTLLFVYGLTVIAEYLSFPQFMLIPITSAICIISVFIITPLVPYGIQTGRKEVRRFIKMRYVGNIFTIFMMNIAVSFGICFVIVGIIGGMLFSEDQHLASIIIKAVLYCIFLMILYTLTKHNGFADTTGKIFNPHIILQSTLLAQTFMMPFTHFDWFKYNALGKDLFYNAQTFLGEFEFMINLGEAGFAIGFLLTSVVNCFFALLFYQTGRNAFFKKHPNELSYDLVEINSIKQNLIY